MAGKKDADFKLIVGVDSAVSLQGALEDIKALINSINDKADEHKIKVKLEADKSAIKDLQQEINKVMVVATQGTTTSKEVFAGIGDGAREAADDVSAAAKKQKTLSDQYKDTTAALNRLFKLRRQYIGDLKSDITTTNNDEGSIIYSSESGNYSELAKNLNEAQRAYDELFKIIDKMPEEKRTKILQTLTEKERELAVAIQKRKTIEANNASKKQEESTKKQTSILNDYIATLIKAENALKKWSQAENSNNPESRQSYEDLKKSIDALAEARENFDKDKSDKNLEALNKATQSTNTQLKETESILKGNGDATKTWGERIGGLAKKFASWYSITRIIMLVVRNIKKMISAVIEIDTAMTELRKVTDATDSTYEKFLTNASARAKKLGADLTDIVSVTADFARLGYNIENAEVLADAAIVYKNVGDGLSDISEASSHIISTMQAFGIQTSEVMSIVDKFNAVGNNFAISSSGVGEALLRSAAAMRAAGNTIDQTIAMAAAANTVIQDPEKVGTTLKTISMFLRAAKTEAEEAGESTEGMVESVSKLRDELLDLTGGAVDIQLDENTFKSTYQIVKELSEVWSGLSDISRANITEMVGGKRNSNVVSALLENFTVAENALAVSMDSAGSALEENEKVLDSIQGRLNIMSASFKELGTTLINGDLIKFLVSLGTGILNVITGMVKFTNILGGLRMILAVIIGLMIALNVNILNCVTNTQIGTKIVKTFGTTLSSIKNGLKNLLSSLKTGVQAWKDFAKGTTSASQALKASRGIIGVAIVALTALYTIYSKYKEARREENEAAVDAGKAAQEEIASIRDAYISYSQYLEKTKNAEAGENDLAEAVDKVTAALGNKSAILKTLTAGTDEYTEKLKELTKRELEEALVSATNAEKSAKELLEDKIYDIFDTTNASYHISFNPNMDNAEETNKIIEDILGEYLDTEFISNPRGNGGVYRTTISPGTNATIDELIQYRKDLIEAQKELVLAGKEDTTLYEEISTAISFAKTQFEDFIEAQDRLIISTAEANIGIPKTIEEFDNLRNYIIQASIETGKFALITGEGETSVYNYVDSLLSQNSAYAAFLATMKKAEDGTEDFLSTIEKIGDFASVISTISSKIDLAKTAIEEMNEGNGLSIDLIKRLADAEENYIDFLYTENGIIKLNTKAWIESAETQIKNNIEIARSNMLKYETYMAQAEALKNQLSNMLGGSSGSAAVGIIAELQRLEEYTEEYQRWKKELDLYTAQLNNIKNDLSDAENSNGGSSDSETWFEKQYKEHKHLLAMSKETQREYLNWLTSAYQRAYNEGILTLDQYYNYQEEVYEGLRAIFQDYLSDIEHEISMREGFDGESKKVISLYKTLIAATEKEIATARSQGLTDEDDYIQELLSKWLSYQNSITSIEDQITNDAKSAIDELVDYQKDMLSDDVESQRDALETKLDYLKEFYDKQKEMLQDQYDEEEYLEQQAEKRKSVTSIQAELAQLANDDSAWAQRRKAELRQELSDAQSDLGDFEKEHALELALDTLEQSYNDQESQIQKEMDALSAELDNPQLLFNQALAAIRDNTGSLYQTMLEYNRLHGTGNDEDIKEIYEEAYKALLEYNKLYGSSYNGVLLPNSTGYTGTGSWDSSSVTNSNTTSTTITTPTTSNQQSNQTVIRPSLEHGSSITVKESATNYSARSGGKAISSFVKGGIYTVYDVIGDEVLIGKKGSYTGWINKSDIVGYASGTSSATAGLHSINEQGDEYIFSSASTGKTYKMFTGGEKVLSAKATEFLYNFANKGYDFVNKLFGGGVGGQLSEKISPTVTTTEIRMGDINITGGLSDQKTVSEIRRTQREAVTEVLREFKRLQK